MILYSYIAVFLMFLVSGTVFASMMHASTFMFLFFFFSLFYAKKNNVIFGRKEFFFLFIYSIYLFANCLFVGDYETTSFNTVIGYVLLATGTLCVMQSIEYDKFRYIYLNIATFIAFTSAILFLLQQSNLIPLKIETTPGGVRFLMFLFNNFGWGLPFDRLAGPYWEPGAFQIVLNYALIMYLNEICSFKFSVPYGKIKLAIIIIALLLTQSTAGYINLFVFAVLTILNMKLTRRTIPKYICIGIALLVACFYLMTSETYTSKMAQKGEKDTSYEIRKNDNMAMLQMSVEKPIWGYGINSFEFRSRGKSLGNSTSSNGLLAVSSQLGCPFLLFIILSLYIKLRKFYPQKTFLVLIILLMLQATEVFIFFPIALIFVFAKIKKEKISQGNRQYLEKSMSKNNENL